MPLVNHPWKLTPEQTEALAEYLEKHGISKSEAGRIALARLLEKKPKDKEIEAARVERGTNNLEEYNRRRARKS